MVVAMTDNLCPSCAAPLRFSRAIFAPTSGDYGEIWRCTAADCGREVFRDEPRCATCGEIISGDAGVPCPDCIQDKKQALDADAPDGSQGQAPTTLIVAPPDFRADFLRRARVREQRLMDATDDTASDGRGK